MKVQIYIRDHEDYANGEYDFSLKVFHDKDIVNRNGWDYTFVAEVEIPEIDIASETQKAVATIDVEISNARAAHSKIIDRLEDRKANLLALEAPRED